MPNRELVMELMPEEFWYGGGPQMEEGMPFGQALFSIDLSVTIMAIRPDLC
ncbi:hypothetical protein ACE3NQ_24505 [Paenibacillus terreus]|uniref:Uncharacterized protein n=1 Tax=Paenibacillus terreus TaxID=1387834 RepID=A0ABV5BEE4_9BACL